MTDSLITETCAISQTPGVQEGLDPLLCGGKPATQGFFPFTPGRIKHCEPVHRFSL